MPTSSPGGQGDGIPGGEEDGHRSGHPAVVGRREDSSYSTIDRCGPEHRTAIVRFAEKEGIGQETPWPDEGKLQVIRQRMGRPGAAVAASQAEQLLKPRTEQIRTWLDKDHLLLSKVHELLGREGLAVCYSSLYRFARKWCDFGTASAISVRRAESLPGEMAEVDFGRLGPLQELGSRQPRMVHGFILTLGYSRLSCVIPVLALKEALPCIGHAISMT